uniref:Secreted protein n=1 Tax=Ixodes ricinus TaxID=34613 RepID=A0A6B0UZ46_IXORI
MCMFVITVIAAPLFVSFICTLRPVENIRGETGRRSSQRKPGCTDARHLGASGNLQCLKPRTRQMTSFEAAVVFHVSFLVSVIVKRLEPPTRNCGFQKAALAYLSFYSLRRESRLRHWGGASRTEPIAPLSVCRNKPCFVVLVSGLPQFIVFPLYPCILFQFTGCACFQFS